MRPLSQSLPADNSTDPFTLVMPDREVGAARIEAATTLVRSELTYCLDAGRAATGAALQSALRALAREIAAVARPNRNDPWVTEVQGVAETLLRLGGHDAPVDAATTTLARSWVVRSWSGVLAAMLVAPAWQVPEAPVLDDVPDWLWRMYAAWLFQTPTRFAGPSGDTLALHHARHLRALERWSARNAGSASLRAAVAGYLSGTRHLGADASPRVWREQAELRGRVLTRTRVRSRASVELPALPRHGRRLRVGFVARDFGPGPAMYGALPCFEELDGRTFDVFLFPLANSDTPEAAYCGRRGRGIALLPTGAAERVAYLKQAQLDVLVFVGDLAREDSEVTELALHRLAPLQVVNHRSGFSTGLPEVDLTCRASSPPNRSRPRPTPSASACCAAPGTASPWLGPLTKPRRPPVGLKSDVRLRPRSSWRWWMPPAFAPRYCARGRRCWPECPKPTWRSPWSTRVRMLPLRFSVRRWTPR